MTNQTIKTTRIGDMAKVIDTGWCCEDCVQAIANDEYSGLDYHYSEPEATERMEAIKAGIAAYAPGYLVIGDDHDEFSTRRCDVCGEHLAGSRHAFSVLGDGDPTAVEQLAERVGADPTDSDFLFGMTVFCMDFHHGQWSTEYAAMCEANARLRDNHIDAIRRGKYDRAGEWEDARRWYRELKRNARGVRQ